MPYTLSVMITEVFASESLGDRIEPLSTTKCMWTRVWFQMLTASVAESVNDGVPAGLAARGRAFDPAHSHKFLAASGTAIEKPPRAWLHRKRQRMATRFFLEAEIAAGTTPSGAVRWNAPATGAELREQMRQLV